MDLYVEQNDEDPLSDMYFHFDLFNGKRKLPPRVWPYAPFYTEARNVATTDQLTRRILTLLDHRNLPGYESLEDAELEAEFLLKGLLVELARDAATPAREPLERHHETVVSLLVAKLFADPAKFRRVSDLANAGGYSVSHFRQLCRRFTGKAPTELLVQARIEKAKSYIRSSELTIGMIAEAVGYENIYYFSRQFREIVGVTATEYRHSG